jgi:sugar/nucleoside kinase (ribokinase family)
MSARSAAINMPSWDLLCIGDPCADLLMRLAQWPAHGSKARAGLIGTLPGGTAANVACAAQRLGLRTALFGSVGNDSHGKAALLALNEFGVDTSLIRTINGSPTSVCLNMLSDDGERSIIYLPPDPAPPMQPARLRAAAMRARAIYTMPYNMDELGTMHALARRTGAVIAIDIEAAVAPTPGAMRARLACADIAFLNESGFRAGTGAAPSLAAMRPLLAFGPKVIVVTCGQAGALAVSRQDSAEQAAFAANVVDTTGAGDCFNASFMVAFLGGRTLEGALRFACAAASCSVGALGARTGLPYPNQVARVSSPQQEAL